MNRIVITRHGGPEVLQVQESPDPKPRAGEVLIRVKAAGLNFADVLARTEDRKGCPPPQRMRQFQKKRRSRPV